MTIFAAASTKAFYDSNVNTVIPEDAIEISPEYHKELLDGQSAGKVISWDESGHPYLTEFELNLEQKSELGRNWRDIELIKTDSLVSRHRDEVEEGIETTLTADQYKQLQTYRRQLRDWTATADFPEIRPTAPDWLEAAL